MKSELNRCLRVIIIDQRVFGRTVHIKINHTPKATANPTHGVFMLKAAKKPTVAIIHVIKNLITVLIIVKFKC